MNSGESMNRYSKVLATLAILLVCSSCSGPLFVSGRVVDQDGNPLSDVKLHTTASVKTKYEADSYGGERSTTLRDGEFKIRCAACSAAHLLFVKDGYHPKSIDLAFFEWSSDLTIVLQKKGPPVDLKGYETRVQAGPEIDDTFLALSAASFVAIRPAMNNEGALAIEVKEFMSTMKFVDLDFSGANGGAQLYVPTDLEISYAYAEMTAAPLDGYTSTIRLSGKQEGQFHFFYCKIDGRYCKGKVSVPRVWDNDGRKVVIASIEVFLNPQQGDRGLDDPHGYFR